jgi:aromatic ring-opening dioxygenase catalytic subunit (LigB family)
METNLAPMPTLFIPHGGGPCFFMGAMPGFPPDLWDRMAAYLRGIDAALGVRPRAVLIISGHWEAALPTVNTAERHSLLFDYYGFPPETYRLTYPARGSGAVAARVRELLDEAGLASAGEPARGLDHGVFVPLKLVYPDADVPVVQLSLVAHADARSHLALGRALAPLRGEGVLIVGSGMSYHNLREFASPRPEAIRPAGEFDEWLTDAVCEPDEARREATLAQWMSAPGARACHPTPEHLTPLLVAAGAAGGDPGRRTYSDRLFGKAVSAFQFG